MKLLRDAGVVVDQHNLLEASWTPDQLKMFFADKPVTACVNRTAPDVKNGVIDPESLNEEELLAAMCKTPILIKRPLMVIDERYYCGFDWDQLCDDLELNAKPLTEDVETCAREQARSLASEMERAEQSS